MRFRDIVGQRELINRIIHAAVQGRIPHAQLFLGPEGTQKLPIALAYAQFLNCKHQVNQNQSEELDGLLADSCGKCPSCIKFEKLQHPDLHFFFPNNTTDSIKKDPKSILFMDEWRTLCLENKSEFSLAQWYEKIGIGNKQGTINARDCTDLLDALSYRNFEANFRFIIIWMADKLYHTAAPRLLKTLEEPCEKTVFILISENSEQILPTILSRTQLIKFPKISEALGSLSEQEEDIFFQELFIKWMRSCYTGDIPELVKWIEQINRLGREGGRRFLQKSSDKLQACLLLRYKNGNCIRLDEKDNRFFINFSSFIHIENIEYFYNLLHKAALALERNANGNILWMDVSLQFWKLLATQKK